MAANLYYDDQNRLIATTDAELEIYFRSLPNVSLVQNLPFVVACPMYALYRVLSSGVLPKYISKNGIDPSQRIYAKLLPQNIVGLAPICNGVTFATIVPPPVIGVIWSIAIDYYETEDASENYTQEDGVDIFRTE